MILNFTQVDYMSDNVDGVILAEINAAEGLQELQDQRISVYAVTQNLPHTLHLITSSGLIMLDFQVDLTSTQ